MATSSSTSTRIGSSKTTEAEALSLFCLWWLGGGGGARAQQCMAAAAAAFLLFEKVLPPFHRKYGVLIFVSINSNSNIRFYILFNFLTKISNFSQFGSNALCLASSVVFVHIKINF